MLVQALGAIKVAIVFGGELSVHQKLLPLFRVAEYRHEQNGAAISQVASFDPMTANGVSVALEFHRIAETGQTHVVLRRVKSGE